MKTINVPDEEMLEKHARMRERVEALVLSVRFTAIGVCSYADIARTLREVDRLWKDESITLRAREVLFEKWHQQIWKGAENLGLQFFEKLRAEAAEKGILGPP